MDDLFAAIDCPPAPPCQHEPVFTATPHLTHHGREDCGKCRKFLRWVPKPETVRRHAWNVDRQQKMATWSLPTWEKGFVAGLPTDGKWSPKQQEVFDKIWREHGN